MSDSNQNAEAVSARVKPWHKSALELATNVKQADGKGKRTVLGYEPCSIPSLDCCFDGLPEPDEIKHDDNGIVSLIYKDEVLNLMQKALTALVLAPVRSAVIWNKNAEGEPEHGGQSNPSAETWAVFLEGSGGSQFLVQKRDWINKFKAYVSALELPQAAKDMLVRLIESGKNISDQDQSIKDKVMSRVSAFVETLSEEEAEEVSSYTNKIASYLVAEAPAADAFEF